MFATIADVIKGNPKMTSLRFFDQAVKTSAQLRKEEKQQQFLSERFTVQYCPCGHVGKMSRGSLLNMGTEKQIIAIEEGRKLDAVILYSRNCPRCNHRRL